MSLEETLASPQRTVVRSLISATGTGAEDALLGAGSAGTPWSTLITADVPTSSAIVQVRPIKPSCTLAIGIDCQDVTARPAYVSLLTADALDAAFTEIGTFAIRQDREDLCVAGDDVERYLMLRFSDDAGLRAHEVDCLSLGIVVPPVVAGGRAERERRWGSTEGLERERDKRERAKNVRSRIDSYGKRRLRVRKTPSKPVRTPQPRTPPAPTADEQVLSDLSEGRVSERLRGLLSALNRAATSDGPAPDLVQVISPKKNLPPRRVPVPSPYRARSISEENLSELARQRPGEPVSEPLPYAGSPVKKRPTVRTPVTTPKRTPKRTPTGHTPRSVKLRRSQRRSQVVHLEPVFSPGEARNEQVVAAAPPRLSESPKKRRRSERAKARSEYAPKVVSSPVVYQATLSPPSQSLPPSLARLLEDAAYAEDMLGMIEAQAAAAVDRRLAAEKEAELQRKQDEKAREEAVKLAAEKAAEALKASAGEAEAKKLAATKEAEARELEEEAKVAAAHVQRAEKQRSVAARRAEEAAAIAEAAAKKGPKLLVPVADLVPDGIGLFPDMASTWSMLSPFFPCPRKPDLGPDVVLDVPTPGDAPVPPMDAIGPVSPLKRPAVPVSPVEPPPQTPKVSKPAEDPAFASPPAKKPTQPPLQVPAQKPAPSHSMPRRPLSPRPGDYVGTLLPFLEEGTYCIVLNPNNYGGGERVFMQLDTESEAVVVDGSFVPLSSITGFLLGPISSLFMKCGPAVLPWRVMTMVTTQRTYDIVFMVDHDLTLWLCGLCAYLRLGSGWSKLSGHFVAVGSAIRSSSLVLWRARHKIRHNCLVPNAEPHATIQGPWPDADEVGDLGDKMDSGELQGDLDFSGAKARLENL